MDWVSRYRALHGSLDGIVWPKRPITIHDYLAVRWFWKLSPLEARRHFLRRPGNALYDYTKATFT